MESFVPEKLAEKLAKYRVTSFCAPPTVYRFLIKEDLSAYDLSALKHASTAGEPLNPEVYNQFKRQFGIGIREAFGQSESTPILGNFIFSPPRPGSIGKPNPMYKVLLLNEEGNPAEVGEEVEIVIDTSMGKPVGLFDGYYLDEARTNSVWRDGKYHTGDMAWMDEDGYFWFIGRDDDVIKSSGYRIGPFEVESALIEHPAVLECAISAAPDPTRGQIVKASVVLSRGFEPSERLVKELQNHVKRVTAPYKYPRIIEFVKELPKTVSGKIKRAQLREAAKKTSEAFI
jgi:acetyl-CoA synthetase